jgi:exonuclease SbcC
MLPLKLDIEGLFSYQTRQTVDFQQLGQAGLFGIFGTVGSGKSSILEAMLLALYGRTDRFTKAGGALNLSSKQLFVGFEFEVAKERYRFEYSGKRVKEKFEKTGHRAYHHTANEWQPLPEANAEKLLGINFENFCRTIIVPQYKFQEFLKLKPADRNEMMEKLFGLERFHLSEHIKPIKEANDRKLTEIDSRLDTFKEHTPEQLAIYEAEWQANSRQAAAWHQEQQQLEKEIQEQEFLQKQYEDFHRCAKDMQEAEKEAPRMQELEQKLDKIEQAQSAFSLILHTYREDQKNYENTRQKAENAQKELELVNRTYQTYVEKKKDILDKNISKENLTKKAADLEAMVSISQKSEALRRQTAEVDKTSQMLQKITAEIAALQQEKTQNQQQRDNYLNAGEEHRRLINFRHWLQAYEQLQEDREKISREKNACYQEITEHQQKIEQVLRAAGVTVEQGRRADLESDIKAIRQQLEALAEVENGLFRQHELAAYAHLVKEGEACPLCGAEHHPNPIEESEIQLKLAEIGQKRDALKDREKALLQYDKELQAIDRILESNRALYHERDRQEKEKDQAIEKQLAARPQVDWANDLAAVVQLEKQFDEQQKQADNLLKQFKKIEQKISEKTSEQVEYQNNYNRIDKDLAANKAVIDNLKSSLQVFVPTSDFYLKSIDKPTSEIEKMAIGCRDKLKELDDIEQKEAHHQQASALAENTWKNALENRATTESKFHSSEQVLLQTLAQHGFDNLQALEQLLAQVKDIPAERKKVVEFRQNLHTLKSRYDQLQASLQGKSFDQNIVTQLRENYASAKQQLGNLQIQIGRDEERIKICKDGIEKSSALRQQREMYAEKAGYIKELESLFKGKAFVNYVSTAYLQELCRAANDRFHRLTKQTLSLETDSANEIVVRDYLHEGQTRPVASLSGGQTFQASLCLALALADRIRHIHRNEKSFFFIDEGFGSLDKESLQAVFDTLRALRAENRVVGIISHVEELQQDIPVFAQVYKDNSKGSKVIHSWE